MYNEMKVNEFVSNYKVIDELIGKIINLDFALEKELKRENSHWHKQNSDYFLVLEKRNQYLNEISDILNSGYSQIFGKFPKIRVHQMNADSLLRRQMDVLAVMKNALEIISKSA